MSPSIISTQAAEDSSRNPRSVEALKIKLASTSIASDEANHLKLISSLFSIGTTKYGGRGAFAKEDIPCGTEVLSCDGPISSTIIKPFRKEVCNECFQYFDGKNLKVKLTMPGAGNLSMFFCSEDCKEVFEKNDPEQIYLQNLLAVEKHFLNGLKRPEEELREPDVTKDLSRLIDEEWDTVNSWDSKLKTMKPSKRVNLTPRITDHEYSEIKYIVGVLCRLATNPDYKTVSYHGSTIEELSLHEKISLEMNLFDILQSTEKEKVLKYPYLLYSYISIYKFIRLVCSSHLQPLISTDTVRSILGKNLSNAFGIWSDVSCETEDKEYFGFGVYPSASYFNHSCAPGVKKHRNLNKLSFRTIRDINAGEELCIDYGNYLDENVHKRRKELSEWFFDCGCEKCMDQLLESSI